MAAGNAIAPAFQQSDGDEAGLYGPQVVPNTDRRSKLIRSKEKYPGHVINACKFGCRDADLDEQMYCRHLVGFTKPGDKSVYFPFKLREGPFSRGSSRFRFTDGFDPRPVLPGDQLVEISEAAGCRVYRPNPAKPEVYVPCEPAEDAPEVKEEELFAPGVRLANRTPQETPDAE